jgi:hypothetical protein
MIDIRIVDLKDRILGKPPIAFLRVEMPTKYHLPLVRVRCALDGAEQDHGLRLDLDKRSFLDRVPHHKETDDILQEAAPKIAEYLGSVLYHK